MFEFVNEWGEKLFLSILHWRCLLTVRVWAAFRGYIGFQYSIGDAEAYGTEWYYLLPPLTFNTPLEMPLRHVETREVVFSFLFQYSIGDAGGSCVWFLCVFKFLCRRVWVSAAAC